MEEEDQKPKRLSAIAEAVLTDLQLVSITLGDQDDAQIIFETLNGHGAELHATDLIRNFIFMRADREGSDGFKLYENLWSPFETQFWAEKQRRGRLLKPRMEWFIQTALQAILGDEVEIGRLYANYRLFALEVFLVGEWRSGMRPPRTRWLCVLPAPSYLRTIKIRCMNRPGLAGGYFV